MNHVIPLNESEEAQLTAAARDLGLAPAELLKKLAFEYLPAAATSAEHDINAKLSKWQQQDGKALLSDVSSQSLFAQWREEDKLMTDEEREKEDEIWRGFEQSVHENRTTFGPVPI